MEMVVVMVMVMVIVIVMTLYRDTIWLYTLCNGILIIQECS